MKIELSAKDLVDLVMERTISLQGIDVVCKDPLTKFAIHFDEFLKGQHGKNDSEAAIFQGRVGKPALKPRACIDSKYYADSRKRAA